MMENLEFSGLIIAGILLVFGIPLLVLILWARSGADRRKIKWLQNDVQILNQRLEKAEAKIKELIETHANPGFFLEKKEEKTFSQPIKNPEVSKETPVSPEPEERVPPILPIPEPKIEPKTNPQPPTGIEPPSPKKKPIDSPIPVVQTVQSPPDKPEKKSGFAWIEEQFAENWTGIIGAVVLVLGAGFLGIYAALKVAPFYRFLMLCGLSGILGGIFIFLQRKTKWLPLASWVRSSAAAIFLFACLGSGQIEGLKWIENPNFAFGLLSLGVISNLILGFVIGKEGYAVLHVVMSLAAMAFLPPTILSFAAATIITLFGIVLTYRFHWDRHLLVMLICFHAFHYYWWVRLDNPDLLWKEFIFVITGLIVVTVAAAASHYQKVYGEKEKAQRAQWVHFLNWVFIIGSASLHINPNPSSTYYLAGGAIGLMLAGRVARWLGVGWLCNQDTGFGQLLGVASLISLTLWNVLPPYILMWIFVECLLFMGLMIMLKEKTLNRIGAFFTHLISLISIAWLLIDLAFEITNQGNLQPYFHMLSVMVLGGFLFHSISLFLHGKRSFDPGDYLFGLGDPPKNGQAGMSFIGFISPLILPLIFLLKHETAIFFYLIAGIFIAMVWLRDRFQSSSLGVGLILSGIILHGMQWYYLYEFQPVAPLDILLYSIPLLLISGFSMFFAENKLMEKSAGMLPSLLLFTQLALLSYFIGLQFSSLIPGLGWLLLALLAFLGGQGLRSLLGEKVSGWRKADKYFLQIAYGLFAAFAVRHMLVHLLSEAYLGIFPVRIWIGFLALGVLGYWILVKVPVKPPVWPSWKQVHPIMLELFLLWAVFMVLYEVSEFYLPMIWVGSAVLLLLLGTFLSGEWKRLLFYSFLFSLATCFQVGFISTVYVLPGEGLLREVWLPALVSILVLAGYLVAFYRIGHFKTLQFPPAISFLSKWAEKLEKRRNPWIIYPAAICVAFFLYGSFNSSVLTLLWVVECFVIFIFSIILKESLFRTTSMVGLAICIIRLVFWDMAQSGTLMRALVFLGVGSILILMNYVYNRFKTPVSTENQESS